MTKAQKSEAVRLLVTWFFEMKSDAQSGEYDCTCCKDDPCPLHRLSKLLREIGVKGIGRIPSAKAMGQNIYEDQSPF